MESDFRIKRAVRMQNGHILLFLTDIVWKSIKLQLKTDMEWILQKHIERRKKIKCTNFHNKRFSNGGKNFGTVNPLLRADNV